MTILSQVVYLLQKNIPQYTPLFTDELGVVSLTWNAGYVSCETTVPHNLVDDSLVNISGALSPNALVNLTQVDNIAYAETIRDHDLTEGYQQTIQVVDANETDYNGTHDLLKAPNRRNFEYQIENDPASPATGSPTLLEALEVGYNGWHNITVVSPTVFQFPMNFELGSPAQGDIKLFVSPRIGGVITVDQAIAAYTAQAQNKLWAYVVFNGFPADKSSAIDTEQIGFSRQDAFYSRLGIGSFSIYIFIPSKIEVSRLNVVDTAYSILPYFCKSLLTARLNYGFNYDANDGIDYLNSGLYQDNGSYCIWKFDYQTTFIMHNEDALPRDPTVALRDIYVKYKNDLDRTIADDYVNEDEEPL